MDTTLQAWTKSQAKREHGNSGGDISLERDVTNHKEGKWSRAWAKP